jgi:hypothetical protein
VRLRVLVGCECSGRVRDAFAALGWEAWSADLYASENPVHTTHSRDGKWYEHPAILTDFEGFAAHYQGDVRDLFNPLHPINAERDTLRNGGRTNRPLWDLCILHPPCDHLSYAGARWFKLKDARRGGDGRMQEGLKFFGEMINAPSPLVCVENPHSIAQEFYGRPKQIVQPFHFGDPYVKAIHLWLKGLPPLWHDNEVVPTGRIATGGGSWRTDKALLRQAMSAHEDSEGRKNRARVRARTMPGMARAMAEQWTPFCEEYYGARLG